MDGINKIQINPYILNNIKECIKNGYILKDILQEYKSHSHENDLEQEFIDEIIACYYQVNQGPDLRDYQQECYEEIKEHFQDNTNKNFKIFWPCGLGKTKMVLSYFKKSKHKKLCIAVPSIILMEQFYKEIRYLFPVSDIYCFSSSPIVDGDRKLQSSKISDLVEYLKSSKRYKIVLTTYHSSDKLLTSCQNIDFLFDLVICDEAHHLHSKDSKKFRNILDVRYKKRLIVTATPFLGKENSKTLSLEKSNVFKGNANKICLLDGINMGYITDYNIVILKFDEDISFIRNHQNNELHISAYMALKSIFEGISKKILIYCNKVSNAKEIKTIIDETILEINGNVNGINRNGKDLMLFNSELNGTDDLKKRTDVLNEFRDSDYGIISSVQLFGEGFDYPALDSVLFAENMNSSIRIIQSGLRPCRKDPHNPDKLGKILIPIFNHQDTKVKQVLTKMKEIDGNINSKICISEFDKFKKSSLNCRETYHRKDINSDTRKLLQKINIEYINDIFHNLKIDNSRFITIDKSKINNIMLTSVSSNTYKNFYRSVLSQHYSDCYWALKYKENGANEKMWKKLEENDLIVFVESEYISFGKITNTKRDKDLAIKYYDDEIFSLIFELEFIKRIKLNKKEFIKSIGYSDKTNLMRALLYSNNYKHIILNHIL